METDDFIRRARAQQWADPSPLLAAMVERGLRGHEVSRVGMALHAPPLVALALDRHVVLNLDQPDVGDDALCALLLLQAVLPGGHDVLTNLAHPTLGVGASGEVKVLAGDPVTGTLDQEVP